MSKKRFVDLFCGIGGFHQAMASKGYECVLASEIDEDCINVYFNNYNIDSNVNVRDVNEKEVPDHELLCGGFPCQAFSKAGKQEGMNDTRGTLFFEIERILKEKKTKYIILENVRNLVSHDQGRTWNIITSNLKALGYRLSENPIILSPHQFGIPQLRERVYILGILDKDNVDKPLNISFDNLLSKNDNSIDSILENGKVDYKYYISEYEEKVLTAWDEFYQGIKETVIGFPVWAQYFKNKESLKKYPEWKQEFVKKNRELYNNNKEFIDEWLKKYNNLKEFKPTHKKFEWQAGKNITSIWEGIIQFRPSGIRVKTPNVFPALVAIVQIPIVGKYRRRLTVRECARLQSFPDSFIPSNSDLQAYKQFGNSVNVEIVKKLYDQLINNDH